jgi:hypothetical protein
VDDSNQPEAAALDPYRIAVLYYFGELGYWKLPRIAADALEQGYDGPALRRLAGLRDPVESDIPREEIDSAFREMGVAAPLPERETQLFLAAEAASRALDGNWNVFDAATHIRIYICHFDKSPRELERIVSLSERIKHGSNLTWKKFESELRDAMSDFLRSHQ